MTFRPHAPHHAQVRYQSDGREVTLEARTDVDCDGEYSYHLLTGRITPAGEIEFTDIRAGGPGR